MKAYPGELEFNNRDVFKVSEGDLPVSCPLPTVPVWNAHPRVYLPIVETGEAVCPYCSAYYILKR